MRRLATLPAPRRRPGRAAARRQRAAPAVVSTTCLWVNGQCHGCRVLSSPAAPLRRSRGPDPTCLWRVHAPTQRHVLGRSPCARRCATSAAFHALPRRAAPLVWRCKLGLTPNLQVQFGGRTQHIITKQGSTLTQVVEKGLDPFTTTRIMNSRTPTHSSAGWVRSTPSAVPRVRYVRSTRKHVQGRAPNHICA